MISSAFTNIYNELIVESIMSVCAGIDNRATKAEIAMREAYILFVEDAYVSMINNFTTINMDSESLEDPTQLFTPIFWPYLEAYFYFIIFLLSGFWLVDYLGLHWFKLSRQQYILRTNTAYIDELEGEYGSFDDYVAYALGLLLLVGWFYLFTLFLHYVTEIHLHCLLVGWGALAIVAYTLPGTLIYNLGVSYAYYLRGAGRSPSFLVEVVLDLIGTLVIFIRFSVQNIRFILIFLAYIELYEFIASIVFESPLQPYTITLNYSDWLDGKYYYMGWYNFNFAVFWTFVYGFYYIGHITLLYLVQVGIYLFLSFWFKSLIDICF